MTTLQFTGPPPEQKADSKFDSIRRLGFCDRFRALDRPQPLSDGRAPSQEPHARAEAFAVARGLAGIAICGMGARAVAT